MRLARLSVVSVGVVIASALVIAQNRGGGSEWPTVYADAQRTSWIRNDAAISVESMSKPGFELQWTTKLGAPSRPSNILGQGVTVNGVMLFTPLSIVTGASNRVAAIDMDTGFTFWERQYDVPTAAGTAACPGGFTSAATRLTNLVPPAPAGARGGGGGGGRGGYAGAVGEPGEGAPMPQRGGGGRAGDPAAGRGAAAGAGRAGDPAGGAAAVAGRGGDPAGAGAAAAGRGGDPAGGAGASAAAGRGTDPAGRGADPAGRGADPARAGGPGGRAGGAGAGGGGGGGGLGRSNAAVFAISGDGMLHTLGPSSGKDVQRPTPFLAANARFSDPILIGNTIYVTTSGNCGGAADGLWAVDVSIDNHPVASWRTNGGSPVGPVAFTIDGTILVAVGPGQPTSGGFANAIVALDPKTLQAKDWFTQPSAEFVTGPLVFSEGDKNIVAAATKDGRVLLLDAASLGGANHSTPLYVSRSFAGSGTALSGALALWQQMIPIPPLPTPPAAAAPPAGAPPPTPPTAPTAAPPPPVATVIGGTRWLLIPTTGAIQALKVTNNNGQFSLEPGWVAGDLIAPMTPLIVNGVVFGLSAGNRTVPAVLRAWDGMTGRELWNSGKTIPSSVTSPSFWSGSGQVYVGTSDGTVYAFGFPMERK